MAQPVKLATPLATVRVRPPVLVQLSTPADGLVPIARVTVVALSAVTTLPLTSSTATATANDPVPVAWMLALVAGWLVKTSCVAEPAMMLKLFALAGAVRDGLLDAVKV